MQTLIYLIGMTIAALFPVAWAAPSSIGKLSNVVGTAFLVRDGQKLSATPGTQVFESDTLQTSERSIVKIQFAGGSNIIAFEKTSLKISEYKAKSEGSDIKLKSVVDIAKGKIRFFVRPNRQRKNDVKFKTSNAVMGIRGTSGAIVVDGEKTTAGLFTGKADLYNENGGKASIVANQQVTAEKQDTNLKVVSLSADLQKIQVESAPMVDSAAEKQKKNGENSDEGSKGEPKKDAEPAAEGESKKQGSKDTQNKKSMVIFNPDGSAQSATTGPEKLGNELQKQNASEVKKLKEMSEPAETTIQEQAKPQQVIKETIVKELPPTVETIQGQRRDIQINIPKVPGPVPQPMPMTPAK